MPLREVQWGEGRKQSFLLYIQQQLRRTEGDRASLVRKWVDHIAAWRAKLPQGDVDFPWAGASSIEVPLTAMHSDPVYSDLLQQLHSGGDLWHVSARNKKSDDYAIPLSNALRHLNEDFIDMRAVDRRAFLDFVILGTVVWKVHWRTDARKVQDYDPTDPSRIIERTEVRSEPRVEHIPLQHFWIPASAWSIEADAPVGGAPWVAHKFWLTLGQLRAKTRAAGRALKPAYDAAAAAHIESWVRDQTSEDDVAKEVRKEDEYEPFRDLRIDLFEVWARFDTDGDGIDEDVAVTLHLPSMTIVRALHNPFLHGKRPFVAAPFLPSFGFYGIGIAEADEWAQETVTMLTNGLIDNVVLANARMLSVPLGSNIDAGEPVHPGKIWFTEPGEKVSSVQLGEVYPSLPNTIESLIQLSELRTGVTELRQGDVSNLPNRTPATTVLESLKLGSKRFDMIMSTLRSGEVMGEIGQQLLQMLAQMMREDQVRWTNWLIDALGEEDGRTAAEALLSFAPADFERSFDITVEASKATANREADKQTALGLVQLLSNVAPQLLQLTGLIEQSQPNSMTRQVAERTLVSSIRLLHFLFERFDIPGSEEILPGTDEVVAMLSGGGGAQALLGRLAPLGQLTGGERLGELSPQNFGFGV